jgi:hypothetical protein
MAIRKGRARKKLRRDRILLAKGPDASLIWGSVLLQGHVLYVLSFLTCDVMCSAAALDIPDQQNAHSITLAVRDIVVLLHVVASGQSEEGS